MGRRSAVDEEVERSVLTELRATGGKHWLNAIEQGGSRATIDGSPGRTRPTAILFALNYPASFPTPSLPISATKSCGRLTHAIAPAPTNST
jgi:hypothetical protein